MSYQTIIEKMRRQRQFRVDLGDGKSMTVLRPPEAEVASLGRGVTLDHIRRYVVAWDGIREADLMAGGVEDAAEFHVELAVELLNDRAEWLGKVASGLIDAVNRRFEERKAALGN